MTTLQAALLGVVQGLTEFIPISSSAHLILARTFFGWEVGRLGLAFDIACHVGTLLAVIAYFRSDIVAMILALPAVVRGQDGTYPDLARNLIVGTVPIVAVGFFFAEPLSTSLRTAEVVGITLAFGAIVMMFAERKGSSSRTESSLTTVEAFGLGFAQATALVPGVSRSGAVLVVAMLLGLKRESAAKFSFLLGVPAIFAAAVSGSLTLIGQSLSVDFIGLLSIGLGISAFVGYFTVKYFIRYVERYSLYPFAAYRFVVAAAVLVWVITI